MEEIKQKPKLTPLSVKVNEETLKLWKELMNEGQFVTCGQFMETLLTQYAENYSNPVKINVENEQQIESLKQQNEALKTEIVNSEAAKNEIQNKLYEASQTISELQKVVDSSNSREAEYKENTAGALLVRCNPLDKLCLQYLSDRENKNRKRNDITPETFFLYAVREMLIKGNKFSINCVPDSKIKEFEKQLSNE